MEFQPFSLTHALVVAVGTAVVTALCYAGLRRNQVNEPATAKAWLIFIVAVQLLNIAYFVIKRPFRFDDGLPLHLCDLMGWVAVLSLGSRHRWARVACVYFGLCLCLQAFVTPIVTEGPQTVRFWLFFVSHLQIVGSAVYELVVRRFQPTFPDALRAMVMLCVYGAITIPLNIATGWNYGFTGNTTPEAPTIIDRLGDWPLRLVWLFAITLSLFLAFTLLVKQARRLQAAMGLLPTARGV